MINHIYVERYAFRQILSLWQRTVQQNGEIRVPHQKKLQEHQSSRCNKMWVPTCRINSLLAVMASRVVMAQTGHGGSVRDWYYRSTMFTAVYRNDPSQSVSTALHLTASSLPVLKWGSRPAKMLLRTRTHNCRKGVIQSKGLKALCIVIDKAVGALLLKKEKLHNCHRNSLKLAKVKDQSIFSQKLCGNKRQNWSFFESHVI